jgi:hypothetical protein
MHNPHVSQAHTDALTYQIDEPLKCDTLLINLTTLQETQALPRVPGFAKGFLSGPRQRFFFAESRARHSSTHDTASFAEGRADGRPGPSA